MIMRIVFDTELNTIKCNERFSNEVKEQLNKLLKEVLDFSECEECHEVFRDSSKTRPRKFCSVECAKAHNRKKALERYHELRKEK